MAHWFMRGCGSLVAHLELLLQRPELEYGISQISYRIVSFIYSMPPRFYIFTYRLALSRLMCFIHCAGTIDFFFSVKSIPLHGKKEHKTGYKIVFSSRSFCAPEGEGGAGPKSCPWRPLRPLRPWRRVPRCHGHGYPGHGCHCCASSPPPA